MKNYELGAEDIDYSKLLILSQLKDYNTYSKYYYLITSGKCKKIKTPLGIAINIDEAKKALAQSPLKKYRDYPVIDTSENSRFNSLYMRLEDMTEKNKIAVCSKSIKEIPRYQDQDGYTMINIIDYIEPQIKIIANKLNVKRIIVKRLMFELLEKLYKERNSKK